MRQSLSIFIGLVGYLIDYAEHPTRQLFWHVFRYSEHSDASYLKSYDLSVSFNEIDLWIFLFVGICLVAIWRKSVYRFLGATATAT